MRSFNDAQKICIDKFKDEGFDEGRLYEPRSKETFELVYKLAEEFSKRQTLTIWLGMDDKKNEGDFTYSSDGTSPTFRYPWGGKWIIFRPSEAGGAPYSFER